MNKNKILFCALIFLCFSITGCASKNRTIKNNGRDKTGVSVYQQQQIKQQIIPPLSKLIPGEKLYYRISWLGINVGHATLEVKDAGEVEKQKAALVELNAWTAGFFRFIYKIDGKIDSYVNRDTFKPIKYYSYTRINKKIIEKSMKYDFIDHKVYAKDKKGEYKLDITDDSMDPLGVFYYFRKNEVVMDQPNKMVVNGGKKNYTVVVYAVRQKMYHVPAGRFWAFQVEPTSESEHQFDDALNAEGSMRIWFSADEKRFPLQIALKVPVGSAVATLMRIEYLDQN